MRAVEMAGRETEGANLRARPPGVADFAVMKEDEILERSKAAIRSEQSLVNFLPMEKRLWKQRRSAGLFSAFSGKRGRA